MRTLVLFATLLLSLACHAESLRHLLTGAGIPVREFSESELNADVDGTSASSPRFTLAAYIVVKDNAFASHPRLVRFDRATGAILRTEVIPQDPRFCCGSPLEIQFIGTYALLSFHISPSANTILVVTADLKLIGTLYGFDVHEVLPGKVAYIEDMVHFAPAHPERLAVADLQTRSKSELYPPKNDALRTAFARKHAKDMPPADVCQKMNDPCKADYYDEDIEFVDNDGRGHFSFIVRRNASHVVEVEHPPDVVASEVALYRYSWNGREWLYCEEEQSGPVPQKTPLKPCTPTLTVTPDLSGADSGPFSIHRGQ